MRLPRFSLAWCFTLSILGLLLVSPSGVTAQGPTSTPPPSATPIFQIFDSAVIVPTWRPLPSPIPIKPPEQRPNWLFRGDVKRYLYDAYVEWFGMTRSVYDIMSWGTKTINMFVQIWLFFLVVLYLRLIAQRVQNTLSGAAEPVKRYARRNQRAVSGKGRGLSRLGK
ncbi:MAG: hypothetical protein IT322_16140 [Anaerolineae bacterium]|nr:hypothetical protein [Anaerolineae bacterium]